MFLDLEGDETVIPTPAAKIASQPLVSALLPSAQPLDLETINHTQSIPSIRWSADGRYIYFESNITGQYNIWRVPAQGEWPIQITVSDERTRLRDPSPDGRSLLYTQDRGGNEKSNIFVLDPNGGPSRNLTNTERIGYLDLQWSPDGKNLAVAAERETRGSYCVYLMNPENGAAEKIAGNEKGECGLIRWSPDKRKLALTRTRDYQHTGVSILDLETREEKTLVPIEETKTNVAMGWTCEGSQLFVNSNANNLGTDGVALLDVADGTLKWLRLGDWESFMLDSSTLENRFIFVRNEAGNHRVFLGDLEGRDLEIPVPAGVLSMARFSADGKRIALLHASAVSSAEI